MISLVLAAVFFGAIHFFVSGSPLRAAIVERTGENVYQAGFSLLSLLGMVWLGLAYALASPVQLWEPDAWLPPISAVLTLLAFHLEANGVATQSPTPRSTTWTAAASMASPQAPPVRRGSPSAPTTTQ